MGAPVYNTSCVGQGTRTAKHPVTSPQTGGLHDIYAKGKHLYGVAQTLYGAYRMGREYYAAARPYMEAAGMLIPR